MRIYLYQNKKTEEYIELEKKTDDDDLVLIRTIVQATMKNSRKVNKKYDKQALYN